MLDKDGKRWRFFVPLFPLGGSEERHDGHLGEWDRSVSMSRTLLAVSGDGRCDEGGRSTAKEGNVANVVDVMKVELKSRNGHWQPRRRPLWWADSGVHCRSWSGASSG